MKKCFSFMMALMMILVVSIAAFAEGEIPITSADVALSKTNYTYTGSPIEPDVVLTYNGTTLTKGTDYDVTYPQPHTNVASEIPMVITGKGSYSGTCTYYYKITEKLIEASDVMTIETVSNQVYEEGKVYTPTPKVTYNGNTLSSDDVYYDYENNTSAGTATVWIRGKGNYAGSTSRTFTISKASISGATVADVPNQVYTGGAITPEPAVTLNGTTLKKGTDIQYTYTNNTEGEDATITITGIGNYEGTVTKTFKILKKDLAKANITFPSSIVYTGSALEPETVTYSGTALTKGTDYSATYSNNTNAGEASVTITGMGDYAGTQTATFTISPKSLSNATFAAVEDKGYTGSAITPEPKLTLDSTELAKNTDFTYTYTDNINVGTATISAVGKGNYTGSPSTPATFKITAKSIANASVADIANQVYTGSAVTPIPVVTLDGVTLTHNKDYTCTYSNNVNFGKATVSISGIGNYSGNASDKNFNIVYQISFDGNGGTSPSAVLTDTTGVLTSIPTSTYSGYTFDGWYTAISGGEKITSTYVFSNSSTVHAHWTQNSYTVTMAKYSGYNLGRAYYRTSTSSSWTELSGNNAQSVTMPSGGRVYFRMVPYSGYYSHPYVYKLTSGGYYAVTPYNYEFDVAVTENLQVRLNFSSAVPTGDSGVTQYLAIALVSLAAGTGLLWFCQRKRKQNT